ISLGGGLALGQGTLGLVVGGGLAIANGTLAATGGGGDFYRDGSVSMTGQFQAISGSSLTPGITFANDNDTGFYNAGANTLAFSTGGQRRMTIESSGQVGIGTSAPGGFLNVDAPAGFSGAIFNASDDGAWRFTVGDNGDVRVGQKFETQFMTISNNLMWFSGWYAAGDGVLTNRAAGFAAGTLTIGQAGEALALKSNHVALGDAAQLRFQELDANGTNFVAFRAPSALATNTTWLLPAAEGGSGQVLRTDGAGSLSWATTGTGNGDFLRDGSLSMTGQFRATSGSSLTPGISFAAETDTGFWLSGADQMTIVTSGQNRMTVRANGDVGIGTTIPAQRFHVLDTAQIGDTTANEGRLYLKGTSETTTLINVAGGTAQASLYPYGLVGNRAGFEFANSQVGGVINFKTSASVARDTNAMSISSFGNVGIGTAN
ncbi:MAG: hypothetical protein AAB250_19170, partial [Bdellovibrionota bacterium]